MPDKSLEVKISANAAPLTAAMAVAKASLASGVSGLNSLAKQAASASQEVKDSLAPALEAAAGKVVALQTGVAKLRAEIKELNGANAEASGTFGKVSAALTEATEKVEGLTARFGAVGKLSAALGEFALAGLGVEQAFEAVNRVAETGEQMEKLSQETGLTTEQLSGLRVACIQTGTSFDDLSKILLRLPGTLQEAATNPSSKAGEALRAMGVRVTDLNTGQLLPLGDVLDQVAAKLASYSDGTNKTALETDIFGAKIGGELIPVLNKLGAEGFGGAIEQARQYHEVITAEDAEASAKFEDDLHNISLGFDGIGRSIVDFTLPALNAFGDAMVRAFGGGDVDKRISDLQEQLASFQGHGGRAVAFDEGQINSQLATLEAQKSIYDAAAAQQTAYAGGAAPGTATAPNLKTGGSLADHQGVAGADNSDDGDNTDESGVSGADDGSSDRVASAKAAQDQLTQIAEDAAAARKEIASSEYEAQVSNWDAEVAQGKMTKSQEIQDEIAATNQVYAADLAEMQKAADLDAAGSAAKAKALDDIQVTVAQHNATLAKLNADLVDQQVQDAKTATAAQQAAAAATAAAWQKAFQPIETAFDSSINGVLQGTETLQTAELKSAQSIALAYIDAAGKKLISFVGSEAMILAQGIATQTGLTAAVTAGTATRTAVEASARATGKAAQLADGAATINQDAYLAAGGAYKAVVGIPIVGPVLAPAAAAAAYAGVMAFDVLSAAGGAVIPAGVNPLVQLHENETVLPAYISQPLTAMLQAGGSSSSSGDTNIHFSPTYNGVGGNAAAAADQAGKAWMNQIIDLTRNGTLRLPGR